MIKSEVNSYISGVTTTLVGKTLTSPILNTPTSNGLSIVQQTGTGVGLSVRNIGNSASVRISDNSSFGFMEIVSTGRLDITATSNYIYLNGNAINLGNDTIINRASLTTPSSAATQVLSKSLVFENNTWNGSTGVLKYNGIVSRVNTLVNGGTWLSFQVNATNPSVSDVDTEVLALFSSAYAAIPNGSLVIGNVQEDASAMLRIDSTTRGVLFPRMTTTQKNAISSPTEGLVVYDVTLHKLCIRVAAAWETVSSS